jgi:hypothetical protein
MLMVYGAGEWDKVESVDRVIVIASHSKTNFVIVGKNLN